MILRKIFLTVILLLFCLNSVSAFALEAYATGTVLVSKEGSVYAGSCGMKREVYQNEHSFSGRRIEETRVGGFVIRQSAYRIGAILVSGPDQTDTMAFELLKNNGITSLAEYAQWLKENIRYARDGDGDNWASPQETIGNKYGDCEDYAFLNAAVLCVLGYHPKVLALMGMTIVSGLLMPNHAVCAFEEGGMFAYFDNGKLKRTSATSLEDFLAYLSTRYRCVSISEIALGESERKQLYSKK